MDHPSRFSANEAARLTALRRYEILDTSPESAFDTVTRLATEVFNVPVSLVSFVDEERIWFKSAHGVDIDQVERSPGLCASVIEQTNVYVVENAIEDSRTLANPLVAGAFGLRFYVGVPLITHDGYCLGSMSIIDFEPRIFPVEEQSKLTLMADLVMEHMERRQAAREALASLKTLMASKQVEDEQVEICAWTHKIKLGSKWFSFEEFLSEHMGWNVSQVMHPDLEDEIIQALHN